MHLMHMTLELCSLEFICSLRDSTGNINFTIWKQTTGCYTYHKNTALGHTPNIEMTVNDSVIFCTVVSTVILSLWGPIGDFEINKMLWKNLFVIYNR